MVFSMNKVFSMLAFILIIDLNLKENFSIPEKLGVRVLDNFRLLAFEFIRFVLGHIQFLIMYKKMCLILCQKDKKFTKDIKWFFLAKSCNKSILAQVI